MKKNKKMIKILFVCLGNICRSPLAEALFVKKLQEKQLLDEVEVDSCGTVGYHIGEPPDHRTVANAKMNGMVLDHKARQFDKSDFRKFDYILVMDNSNKQVVQRLDEANQFAAKIFLFRDFDNNGKGQDVPDPYFGGEEGFQQVFEILDRTTDNLLHHIIKEHNLG